MSGIDGGLAKYTSCDCMYCDGIITFCKECRTGFCDDVCREWIMTMTMTENGWICHPCKQEVEKEKA